MAWSHYYVVQYCHAVSLCIDVSPADGFVHRTFLKMEVFDPKYWCYRVYGGYTWGLMEWGYAIQVLILPPRRIAGLVERLHHFILMLTVARIEANVHNGAV